MPVISQIGVYAAGTFGFPIQCELNPLVTDIFSNVTSLKMDLFKPDGSNVIDRVLPLPGSIVDVNGKLRFTVEDGDFEAPPIPDGDAEPLPGVYTVIFKIDYSGGAHLNFGGDFNVTKQ